MTKSWMTAGRIRTHRQRRRGGRIGSSSPTNPGEFNGLVEIQSDLFSF